MIKKRNRIVAVLVALMLLSGSLTLIGIILLPAQLVTPELSAQENLSGVGYFDYPPSCGLLLCDEQERGIFIFFDFENILTEVRIFEKDAVKSSQNASCRVDYTLFMPKGFCGAFCDRIGGVEMADENGQKSLYFSAAMGQITQKNLTAEKLTEISSAIFEKISKIGLSSGDFMFIIESVETSLPYSVCYNWIPYMEDMFRNVVFY